jgi:hypothetical protein
MRRAAFSGVFVLMAVVLAALPASAAGPPGTATGTYQIPAATDNVQVVKAVGGNLFLHEDAPLVYSGDITGNSVDVDNFVVQASGTFEGHGVETCGQCTIGGRTGSYVAAFNFVGSGDAYTGRLTFLTGGGGLTGLRGGGAFAGTESGTGGTYSYQYLFNG